MKAFWKMKIVTFLIAYEGSKDFSRVFVQVKPNKTNT